MIVLKALQTLGFSSFIQLITPFASEFIPLHKIGCIRQFESKLSLHSLALFLHKIGCIRQFESKLSLRSLALFLHHLELFQVILASSRLYTQHIMKTDIAYSSLSMHPLVKRIAQAIILFSICLCAIGLPLPLQAQMDSLVFMTDARIDASQRGEIRLNVDNLTFLRDNEYKGRLVKGYTLPGIWIEPTVSYQPLDNLKVEAGMHLLHYWGANVYPNLNYSSIPTWQNGRIQKSFHALPLFRAQMQLTPSLNLVVGTLYGKQNHGLIAPLYNDELNLSSDPESGLQLLWHTRPFSLDAWLNWESFIFRGDDHQESFTFGFSSRIHPSKPSKRTQVYLPVQVLFHHRTVHKNLAQCSSRHRCGLFVGLSSSGQATCRRRRGRIPPASRYSPAIQQRVGSTDESGSRRVAMQFDHELLAVP